VILLTPVILNPQSREDLSALLASNFASGGRIENVDLSAVASLVEHQPEDMTASVEAGMTVRTFQERLRASGQWLPIDPPDETITIGDLLAFDVSGSRRLGYGTIRDYLLGIRVVMADGTVIKAGGKVVKNVAGYDLCKLFIGAQHSIGIIVEATFKLRPLPEKESFVRAEVESLEPLEELRKRLWSSRAEPVIFDAHNMSGKLEMVAAFAGNREDVDSHVAVAREMGFGPENNTDYVTRFWADGRAKRLSGLPSHCVQLISETKAERWLLHLGNGIIHFRGGNLYKIPKPAFLLNERIKQEFDPKQIFSAAP
jgi:FAD/FMN-containing dehydrogenase